MAWIAGTSASLASRTVSSLTRSDVEAEFDDVIGLHDVVLALEPRLAGGARIGDRSGLDEVLEADHLGTDEATFEVGVDHAGCLGRRRPDRDRPGAHLLLTGREVGLQPERVLRDARQPVEAR